ncbi:MAG: type II 3-dehydroquinate dehydratase [Clostridia bacterium]|nr:type II 3-dehydroquinate dehydratase [Clostridia bacterium]
MKILVINGPNINMLGIREPEIYGKGTYAELCETVKAYCEEKGVSVEIYQSNHEGCLIDKIQQARGTFDGIVINPAAYTHTSIALYDAVKAVGVPTVEVHITDPDERELFRKISYIRPACIATVKGKGFAGYNEAVDILLEAANEGEN